MKKAICLLLICAFTFYGTVCNASDLKENVEDEPVKVGRAEVIGAAVGATVGRVIGKAMNKTTVVSKIVGRKVAAVGSVVGNTISRAITPDEAKAIGIAAASGAVAGAVTYSTIGGSGLAICGTAVGVTLAPYMIIGAGVGVTVYGVYHILATN